MEVTPEQVAERMGHSIGAVSGLYSSTIELSYWQACERIAELEHQKSLLRNALIDSKEWHISYWDDGHPLHKEDMGFIDSVLRQLSPRPKLLTGGGEKGKWRGCGNLDRSLLRVSLCQLCAIGWGGLTFLTSLAGQGKL